MRLARTFDWFVIGLLSVGYLGLKGFFFIFVAATVSWALDDYDGEK